MPNVIDIAAYRNRLVEAEVAAQIDFIDTAFDMLVTVDDNPCRAAAALYTRCVRQLAKSGVALSMLQDELVYHHADALAAPRVPTDTT
jgi:hypothetical protein